MAQPVPESIPVVSVADLARRLKRAVESQAGREWVEGEILSFKRAASGHAYFSLKDPREDACIECVMYRLDALRVRQHLFEGARVQTLGRVTLWPPRGRLQFIVQSLRPVGRGALLEQLERLKAKLRAEGLFERERKRPLPPSPRVVGVITSAHGAALHDIRTVAFRRGPVILVLAPALVQGELAPESLVQALDRIERDRRVEVVIIGRGGGASEDLMAFNDERVVRRVACLRVPTVSAVGHEVDITLTDLVADVRAATPSQAAELVVPEQRERIAQLLTLRRQLVRAVRARWAEDVAAARALRARLSDPRFVIAQHQQGLDEHRLRAERAIGRHLARSAARVEGLERRLLARHPRVLVLGSRSRAEPLAARLRLALTRRLERERNALARFPAQLRGALLTQLRSEQSQLATLRGQLSALSPLTVLRRGYSIVSTDSGRILTSSSAVAPGDTVRIRLAEGRLSARVEERDEEAR
ncbi:MAG TPA: exodeoxyribonuclease VII large subunit [Polyangiaceae bacterium]|nr:exodeoxyribonuclease VII large subunit [Polyangiaceae bacterium]